MINIAPFARFALTTDQKVALMDRLLADVCKCAEHDQRADHFALSPEMEQIKAGLDALEARAEPALIAALEQARDVLIALVRRDFNGATTPLRWVNALTLKRFGAFQSEMADLMRGAVDLGSRMVAGIGMYDSSIYVTPKAAIRAMQEKAVFVSGVTKDSLTQTVKAILIAAIKNGEPLAETVGKLLIAFDPYVGNNRVLRDQKQAEPYRLRTIVRTNVTEAFNVGRLQRLREPDSRLFSRTVRYSAAMDERTTELCQFLNGKHFDVDDPNLDRLVPPNHFNCRSILVGVPISRPVDRSEYATEEDVGKALDMMTAGFGGSKTYAQLVQSIDPE